MDYSINFWDRIADRYAKKPVADEATYQQKLAVTQQYFRPDMNVLEFGCGTGSTAIVHAPHVKTYHAIDVSPKMIAIAQRKLADTGIDNLTFSAAPIEEVEVADGSLDAVLGLSILHLLNDHDAAIRRVYKMLKPGGVFVSSTACLSDNMSFLRYILPIGRVLGLTPPVKFFSRQDLDNSMTAAGFRIDYRLVPKNNKVAYFMIAVKPAG